MNTVAKFLVVLVILAIVAIPCAFCLEYTVEFWASFAGRPTDIPMMHPVALIGGLVLSEVVVPAAIVTWLLSFVLA